MRARLQGREVSRLAWSAAVGAFVSLAALAGGSAGTAALVAGVATGAAVALLLRFYSVGSAGRP
jgi:hypothetical protein